MKYGCVISLCILCHAIAAQAEDDRATIPRTSLFFTGDEVKQIEAQAGKAPQRPLNDADIHLGAVFYYGPHDWTLWLQGMMWTPQTDRADIHIIEVMPEQVRLSLTAAAGVPAREFTLKPHQTYQTATGMVVEGMP